MKTATAIQSRQRESLLQLAVKKLVAWMVEEGIPLLAIVSIVALCVSLFMVELGRVACGLI